MVSLETAALAVLILPCVLALARCCDPTACVARDAQEPAVEGGGWVGGTNCMLICM